MYYKLPIDVEILMLVFGKLAKIIFIRVALSYILFDDYSQDHMKRMMKGDRQEGKNAWH